MTRLIADALLNDPRFQRAKQEILSTLLEYCNTLSEVRPPQTTLKVEYEEAIKQLGSWRGQDLFFPYLGSGIGKGALVELADGSVKYDFISGIGTHWGHCHEKLVEASLEASVQDICMQGNLQQNRDAYALIELLVRASGIEHCILTTSGAMANENALKILFQKKAPAHRVLAFEKCFMGRTLALSQITDKAQFRQGLPQLLHVDYIPYFDVGDPEGSKKRALDALRGYLNRFPGSHACMCFELILGEAGAYPGQRDFFVALMQLLKESTIPIFVDEIQTFGRTEKLFAFQTFGLEELVDVVTCGKLLHACATLYKEPMRPQAGLISQTFLSATSSIRVGTIILKSLLEDGYLGASGKNMQIRQHFVSHLERLSQHYPDKLEGPFGMGLMIGCTLYKGDKERVTQFAKMLFEKGLIGFIAGAAPTRMRFLLPPGGVSFEDIDRAATILEHTLREL